jgi:membrane peptidoglycan carboxypeptidase
MKMPRPRRRNVGPVPVLSTVGRPLRDAGRRHHIASFLAVCMVAGALVAGLALPVIGGAAMAAKNAAEDFQALPEKIETIPPAEASVVLAADGQRIASFYDENRVAVPLSKVSSIMKKAILAIEDARFYDHGGIDLKGTLRALVSNSGGEGGRQGGSTLTQQYVKNLLIQLSDGDPDKIAAARAPTIKRKLQELKYALEIEKRMTKDEILENYLNISYFGSGSYGIEAASRRYFSKSSNNLTLTEAALLAGIVRSPSGYDPTRFPEEALERRNVVLTRMRDVGFIRTDQLDKAKAEDLGLRVSPISNGCTRSSVPFFCDYITRVIQNDPIFGANERDRSDLLARGGLTIRTTIDLKTQKAADDALRAKTNPTDKVAGAVATIEPGTGKIRAMAISREYGNGAGKTVINYATDFEYGGSRGFQDGSTHKAFTAAAAIAEGYGTEYKIHSPFRIGGFKAQRNCDGKRVDPGGWNPKNFENKPNEYGPVITMREGMRKSVNTYFAQLEVLVGLCDTVTMAEAAGIHRADGLPQDEFLPYTLGVNAVSPLTVANSYATFAARGVRCTPIAIESITGRDGKPVEVPKADCKQTIKQEVADAMNNVMQSVMQPKGFGYNMRLASGQPAGGKTGTTNGAVAIWFTGYTPTLSTAVWLGNPNDYSYKMDNVYIGGVFYDDVCGSCVPGPIWKAMMDEALKGTPITDFAPADARWLRGTKGEGDPRKAHVTYSVAKPAKAEPKKADNKADNKPDSDNRDNDNRDNDNDNDNDENNGDNDNDAAAKPEDDSDD